MTLDDFITRVTQRPLPTHPLTRIRTLAKELAEGAADGLWGVSISVFRGSINEDPVQAYFTQRWNDQFPGLGLLIGNGYLSAGNNEVIITKAAFDLLEEVEPSSVFISYRRRDSSAFALLVLAKLKEQGVNAFLDLAIQPGENWRARLKNQIVNREHLVLLLGKDTLSSPIVLEEITMALESGLNIIPVWHNEFVYQSGTWDNIPVKVDKLLSETHTIRVLEESAIGYNNAIVELLNYFGMTP